MPLKKKELKKQIVESLLPCLTRLDIQSNTNRSHWKLQIRSHKQVPQKAIKIQWNM